MDFILLCLGAVVLFYVRGLKRRLAAVEERVERLQALAHGDAPPAAARVILAPEPAPAAVIPVATGAAPPAEVPVEPAEADAPVPPPEPVSVPWAPAPAPAWRAEAPPADPPPADLTPPAAPRETAAAWVERVGGGQLPIWAGGAALAIAGFFLVGYAIESGLLTPPVRVVLASLFGVLLLGLAEAAARIPLLARDPRVAQALGGAGIATLYAAAYLCGGHYGLVSPTLAFLLMAAVTALALGLALVRGAPVAIMGLVGGFATPLLAGAGSDTLWPLLIYLGALVAGLFAIALHRGWLWLGLLALLGGFGWSLALVATAPPAQMAAVGLFVIALAVAAAAVAPAATVAQGRAQLLRMLPLAAGLVQLALILPRTGFGLTGWSLYLTLSFGCVWLAMRDPRTVTLPLGALLLSLVALGGTLWSGEVRLAVYATLAVTLIFAGAGHMFARREPDGPVWAAIGAIGLLLPAALLRLARPELLGAAGWALVGVLLALPALHLAWRSRDRARAARPFDLPLQLGAAAAAVLLGAALREVVPEALLPAGWLLVALALAAAARHIGDRTLVLQAVLATAAAGAGWIASQPSELSAATLSPLIERSPPLVVLQGLVLPAAVLAAIAAVLRGRRSGGAYAVLAALLLFAAAAALVPAPWRALAAAGAALATTEGARRLPELRPAVMLAAPWTLLWMAMLAADLLPALLLSIEGVPVILPLLPSPATALRALLVPAPLLALALWRADDLPYALRRGVAIGAAVGFGGGLYILAKQPMAIATTEAFEARGFLERMIFTQALFAGGAALVLRGALPALRRAGVVLGIVATARLVWFDLLVLNPAIVAQHVGALPILTPLTLHVALATMWIGLLWHRTTAPRARLAWLAALIVATGGGALLIVRQAFRGAFLTGEEVSRPEFYAYSAAGVLLSTALLAWGARTRDRPMRIAGLGLLALTSLKVFLVDVAELAELLRIASLLGLGFALIAIGWAYNRFLSGAKAEPAA